MTITRRDFLQRSAIATATLGLPLTAIGQTPVRRCIYLMLVGGPSQLDTWDPKPDAPSGIRGPFSAIRTCVPGLYLSELFPRMAANADRFSVVRSLHHTAAPIHETGLQLLQTGTFDANHPAPSWGGSFTTNVLLPEPIGFTGLNVGHGQDGRPGPTLVPDATRAKFGPSRFGEACWQAAQLVERGPAFVTVNMFTQVYDALSWDCHAAGGSLATTLADYRQIAPVFDIAYTALLEHLHERGLLASTLVVATGEMGRTPHMNRDGGRDHWTGVWSMLLAGGGIQGGSIIGASDAHGAEPKDDPYTPERFAALMRNRLAL